MIQNKVKYLQQQCVRMSVVYKDANGGNGQEWQAYVFVYGGTSVAPVAGAQDKSVSQRKGTYSMEWIQIQNLHEKQQGYKKGLSFQ